MIGESNPINALDREARDWAAMRRDIAELKRLAQGRLPAPPCGFYVKRTVNEGTLAGSSAFYVTFNNVVEQHWSTFAGYTSGAGLTVPPEGAGLYALHAGVYWGAYVAGIYAAITVNGNAVAPTAFPNAATDRTYLSGTCRLAPGDVVALRVGNFSATAITVQHVPNDPQTVEQPFLSAWRIST